MTKEITKAFILQQLQEKFGLRELTPEVFSFLETVIPTYEINDHLSSWISLMEEKSITSAIGFIFFTVPQNERWHLNRYNVTFMGAGALTVAGVYVRRHLTPTYTIYLDLLAGQTVSYTIDLPKTVILDSGDALAVNVDGYTSTQNLRLSIDFKKEEIR